MRRIKDRNIGGGVRMMILMIGEGGCKDGNGDKLMTCLRAMMVLMVEYMDREVVMGMIMVMEFRTSNNYGGM